MKTTSMVGRSMRQQRTHPKDHRVQNDSLLAFFPIKKLIHPCDTKTKTISNP